VLPVRLYRVSSQQPASHHTSQKTLKSVIISGKLHGFAHRFRTPGNLAPSMHLALLSYQFTSKLSTFSILPPRNNRQRVELWLNDECISSHDCAELAATDVATH